MGKKATIQVNAREACFDNSLQRLRLILHRSLPEVASSIYHGTITPSQRAAMQVSFSKIVSIGLRKCHVRQLENHCSPGNPFFDCSNKLAVRKECCPDRWVVR